MAAVRLTQLWDSAHNRGTAVSWFQQQPTPSLALIDSLDIPPTASVIDVGGGASTLAGALITRKFTDVTVLDISTVGMSTAQQRLGTAAKKIEWIDADLLTWEPSRTYLVWHDRAVFHFLTSANDRRTYARTLDRATAPGAIVLIATFALDGPDHCSGLPVRRYDAEGLAQELGATWQLIRDETEKHVTPAGVVQPFTWATFRHA